MKLEYCNKPVVCICLIIAILIVFTNCAGSFMAATDKLTIGAVSSANINIEKNNNEINIFKKNPI